MHCYQQLGKESGSMLQHRPLGRHEKYTLDDSEERAIKRPKLMESDHSQMESSEMKKVSLRNPLPTDDGFKTLRCLIWQCTWEISSV